MYLFRPNTKHKTETIKKICFKRLEYISFFLIGYSNANINNNFMVVL